MEKWIVAVAPGECCTYTYYSFAPSLCRSYRVLMESKQQRGRPFVVRVINLLIFMECVRPQAPIRMPKTATWETRQVILEISLSGGVPYLYTCMCLDTYMYPKTRRARSYLCARESLIVCPHRLGVWLMRMRLRDASYANLIYVHVYVWYVFHSAGMVNDLSRKVFLTFDFLLGRCVFTQNCALTWLVRSCRLENARVAVSKIFVCH